MQGYTTPKHKGRRGSVPTISPVSTIQKEHTPTFNPYEIIIALFFLEFTRRRARAFQSMTNDFRILMIEDPARYQAQYNERKKNFDLLKAKYNDIFNIIFIDVYYYTIINLVKRPIRRVADTQPDLRNWFNEIARRPADRRFESHALASEEMINMNQLERNALFQLQHSTYLGEYLYIFVDFVVHLLKSPARHREDFDLIEQLLPVAYRDPSFRENIVTILKQKFSYNGQFTKSLIVKSTLDKLKENDILISEDSKNRFTEMIIGNIDLQNYDFIYSRYVEESDEEENEPMIVSEETQRNFRIVPDSDDEMEAIGASDDDDVAGSQFGYYYF